MGKVEDAFNHKDQSPMHTKYAHEKAATIAVQIKKAKCYITAILFQLITVVSKSSDIRELTAQQRQPMRFATSIKFHSEPKKSHAELIFQLKIPKLRT